jgi:hypothetical protein
VGGILKHLASKLNLAKDNTMAVTNAEEFVRMIQPRTSIKLIHLPEEETK